MTSYDDNPFRMTEKKRTQNFEELLLEKGLPQQMRVSVGEEGTLNGGEMFQKNTYQSMEIPRIQLGSVLSNKKEHAKVDSFKGTITPESHTFKQTQVNDYTDYPDYQTDQALQNAY